MDTAQQNMPSFVQNEDLLEEKLKGFMQSLKDLGLNDQQINILVGSITTTATEQTVAKISALMDEEEFEKWKKFVDSGANNAQQLIVINKFIQQKTNKDLETINMEIIDSLLKDTLEEIVRTRDLKIKISQLSSEEVSKAKELLDAGDFDAVDRVINKQ